MMKKSSIAAITTLAIAFGLGDVQIGGQDVVPGFVSNAEARVGHPLTPVSAAGVARRTTRRVVRRGAYIAVIPAGCPYGAYYGYNLYYCGGTYYQASGSGFVIVYF